MTRRSHSHRQALRRTGNTTAAQIARISELSQTARTTWFALLGYLAFVGVTLLGVEDADFFIDSRQTDLPLVGVAIPTSSFFKFAPILGAALYIYLHLHLRKLWEALHAPPPAPGGRPLDEQIYPWLVNDLVLRLRADGSARPRPLDKLAGFVTRLLVWAAGPIVLLYFWWRSMPAHEEWMTLLIGTTLLLSLYAGFSSWWRLRACRLPEGNRRPVWSGWIKRPVAILIAFLIVAISWLRTEAGFDHYAMKVVDLYEDLTNGGEPLERFKNRKFRNGDDMNPQYAQEVDVQLQPWILKLSDLTLDAPSILIERLNDQNPDNGIAYTHPGFNADGLNCGLIEDAQTTQHLKADAKLRFEIWLVCTWPDLIGRSTLARTDLRGVEIVPGTANIPSRDMARRRFRAEWCARQGLEPSVCGNLYSVAEPAPDFVEPNRRAWCSDNHFPTAPQPFFEAADRADGDPQPATTLASRPSPLTAEAAADCDKHFADLDEDFREEWQQERENTIAQLDRRILRNSDLRGADMALSNLTNVDLGDARMKGADLSGARMEDVDFREARMDGAILIGARMVGADLWDVRMEGADLRGAQLQFVEWSGAHLPRSLAHSADFRGAKQLFQVMLQDVIGDEDTQLPPHLHVWTCWIEPPPGIDAMAERFDSYAPFSAEDFKSDWLCPEGTDPQPTRAVR